MRLTKKNDNEYELLCSNLKTTYDEDVDESINKLGQLEDIEDGLGVDLLVREKALQNGAWYKSSLRGIVFCPFVRIVGKGKALELKEGQRTPTLCVKTCEYGLTWALTEDELL